MIETTGFGMFLFECGYVESSWLNHLWYVQLQLPNSSMSYTGFAVNLYDGFIVDYTKQYLTKQRAESWNSYEHLAQ